jgi:hypothetical protein
MIAAQLGGDFAGDGEADKIDIVGIAHPGRGMGLPQDRWQLFLFDGHAEDFIA